MIFDIAHMLADFEKAVIESEPITEKQKQAMRASFLAGASATWFVIGAAFDFGDAQAFDDIGKQIRLQLVKLTAEGPYNQKGKLD